MTLNFKDVSNSLSLKQRQQADRPIHPPTTLCLMPIGNESVPIQLAQCRFPGLAISNAKILIRFSNKIYRSNFIKQYSKTVTVWNYRNADCSSEKKISLRHFITIFNTLSFATTEKWRRRRPVRRCWGGAGRWKRPAAGAGRWQSACSAVDCSAGSRCCWPTVLRRSAVTSRPRRGGTRAACRAPRHSPAGQPVTSSTTASK